MSRHYWIRVRPSEGPRVTFEAITYEGAYAIARREAERWKRGAVITIESVPVRRARPRTDFEGRAEGGAWQDLFERRGVPCSD